MSAGVTAESGRVFESKCCGYEGAGKTVKTVGPPSAELAFLPSTVGPRGVLQGSYIPSRQSGGLLLE